MKKGFLFSGIYNSQNRCEDRDLLTCTLAFYYHIVKGWILNKACIS